MRVYLVNCPLLSKFQKMLFLPLEISGNSKPQFWWNGKNPDSQAVPCPRNLNLIREGDQSGHALSFV